MNELQKDAEKLVNDTRKKYGKQLQFMMIVYKTEDGKQIKFTQHLETDNPDIVVSFLERTKALLINVLNRGLDEKMKIKRKKGKE